MTRTTWGAAALLLGSASMAQAGALDRTGQPITVIFEDGNYVELSFARTFPEVEGTFTGPLGEASSGDVAPSFAISSFALKYDLTDRLALALTIDQPFGADVDYDDTDLGYPLAGSEADFRTQSVTALARYRINDGFSVHGGLRYVEVDADLTVAVTQLTEGGPATVVYDAEYGSDSDVGYVIGAAYERPDIALRVALTYSSELEFENDADFTVTSPLGTAAGEGTTEYTLPQSVNLDFRTGIAAGTAIIGGVRWVDWSETEIGTPGYPFPDPAAPEPVVDYDGDYVTYTLGVGRQFGERVRAVASVVYEDGIGGDTSNLSPFDGQTALVLGATYLLGTGVELTGGLRYAWLGDATTQTIGAEFEDNTSTSVAVRVGYRF